MPNDYTPAQLELIKRCPDALAPHPALEYVAEMETRNKELSVLYSDCYRTFKMAEARIVELEGQLAALTAPDKDFEKVLDSLIRQVERDRAEDNITERWLPIRQLVLAKYNEQKAEAERLREAAELVRGVKCNFPEWWYEPNMYPNGSSEPISLDEAFEQALGEKGEMDGH